MERKDILISKEKIEEQYNYMEKVRQLLGDGEDELIKRAYINITAEAITAD